ncbi:hypothetical protein QE381_001772 [Microbacterium sp. SORGH_AS 888]|nr:hypothetical protein [Microbacterium sp. SORGH_AS_0888]
MSAIARAESGVSLAGLCTIVFPATSAGAIFELDRISGKLKGVMAATTPIGSFLTYACVLPVVSRTSPSRWWPRLA